MRKVIINSQGKALLYDSKFLAVQDGLLPAGYRELLGIKFDGNFHYETGEKLLGSDVITLTLSQTVTTGQNVFGCYSGTASGRKNLSLYVYGNNSSSNSYLRMDETLYRPRFGTGERTLMFGNLDSTDGFLNDVATTPSTYETDSEAYIGWLPNSTSPHYTGAINVRIYVSNRLLWIPAERQDDGEIGYFELYKEKFIEKTGTGTPVSLGYKD